MLKVERSSFVVKEMLKKYRPVISFARPYDTGRELKPNG